MDRAAGLRETMVAHLERTGVLRLPHIAAAMRHVPRHRFLPGVPLEDAYADRAIAIKVVAENVLSSVSQPGMIAQMLELLAAGPGDRVLEVGTGSGYNAALLSAIVGPHGRVTSVDLDPELARLAGETLAELGYGNVSVLAADGASERHDEGRFDRVIVTARTDDLAAAWWEAARDGARVVVPLRLEGAGEYAVGFVHADGRMRSVGLHPCAFVPMRGQAAQVSASELFYRDRAVPDSEACVRNVAAIVAVRRDDARPELLHEADLVIARPVSVFGVRFTS